MSYMRVLPRDAFNEAKLLKCLGQLIIEIEKIPELEFNFYDENQGFKIEQYDMDGTLWADNFHLFFKGYPEVPISIYNPYNSKDTYPMWFEFGTYADRLFNDNGTLTNAFKTMVNEVMNTGVKESFGGLEIL